MELFPDGGFLRLRNRARGKYLHADVDSVGLSVRALGAVPSLNAVWKAEHWPVVPGGGGNGGGGEGEGEGGGGDVVLLLQGAAYGQYLAVAHEGEYVPPGHRGIRAVQRDYHSMDPDVDDSFAWRVTVVEEEAGGGGGAHGQNCVRLQGDYGRFLRANGRHRHWIRAVTVDIRNDGDETTMMQWIVEPIPSTPEPLPLPPPPPPPPQPPIPSLGLFKRRVKHWHALDLDGPPVGRRIRHLRLDDDGYYVDEEHWPEFLFYGNSVFNLRHRVAQAEGVEGDENITLGVQPGSNGRVIPLVSNLANNLDLMEIVVFNTGSPVTARLMYPQL